MSKLYRFAAAALVFVMILCAFPAVALTAQAADTTSGGYVIFEETFDINTDGSLKSGHTYSKTGSCTIANGLLTVAAGANRHYLDFAVSGFHVPVLSSNRGYVALKVELFVHESSDTTRYASLQIQQTKDANGATVTFSPDVTVMQTTSGMKIGQPNKKLTSMVVRVGGRENGSGAIVIEGVRISAVVVEKENKNVLAQDMGRFLDVQGGFFQLQRDMTFDAYTLAADNSLASDLIMGSDAVLDLNGHNLTIADGSSLKVGSSAKIVDSSAAKTGKITCAKDAVTVANSAHPTLPVWTGSGYVFAEPELIGDTHIFVAPDSRTLDTFKLHFRPGFGTLGGVNVREAYLSQNGGSDIKMSAYITSTDIYGKQKKLQYNGSEEIILDHLFDGMYETATSRVEIAFEGFEKFEKIDVTIKLTSQGVACTFPAYTVSNTYITKHFGSKFDTACANADLSTTYNITGGTNGDLRTNVTDAGKLDCVGSSVFGFDSAVATGSGTLVFDFDITLASGKAVGFDNRIGSARYYVFATNNYGASGQFLQKLAISGTKHVRVEIDLATFAATYYLDGSRYTVGSPASGQLENFITAWNGKTSVILDMSGAAVGACVLDNLAIYTIKNP